MPNSGNIATISGNLVTNSGIDLSTKADLVNGLIPSGQLPSYVDDVLEYANLAGLPATGEAAKIYVTLDNNKIYRWSGSTYIEISPSPGSTDSVAEGSTNLYFTDARARAAISLTTTGTSGAATYTNGVINIPQYQAAGSYLTAEADTLATVTGRGATTATQVTLSGGLKMGNATLNPSGDSNHFHFNGTAIIPNSTTTANNANLGSAAYRWNILYGGDLNLSGSATVTANVTAAKFVVGSVLGTSPVVVNGSANESQVLIKKSSQSSFSVLTWDGTIFLASNIYYSAGACIHSAPASNNNNQLFVFTPGTGITWYASNNGSGSWNVANNITLWNDSGVWQRPVSSVSGTTNYISKFTSTTAVGNSQIFDNGTLVGIGTTSTYIDANDKFIVAGGRLAVNVGAFSPAAFNRSNGGTIVDLLIGGYGKGYIGSNGTDITLVSYANLLVTATSVGIGTTSPQTGVILDARGATAIAGGTEGLRIGSVGDNSSYDNVKIYYTGYNGGAPRVYLTPRTTPGSGVVESYFYIQNSNGASTTSNNTMGLLVDGSVGIGTTTPTQKLSVIGNTYVSGRLSVATTSTAGTGLTVGGSTILLGYAEIQQGNVFYFYSAGNTSITQLSQNGTNFYINATGNVGISTTTPAHKLDVVGGINSDSYISLSNTLATTTNNYLYRVGTSLYWKRNRVRSYIERTITGVSTAPADYNKYYEIGSFAFSSLEGVFNIDLTFNGSGYGQGSRHVVPVSYAMDYLTGYSTGLTTVNGAGIWLVVDAISQTPRHLMSNAANWELQMNVNNNTVQFRIAIKGGTAGTCTAFVKISHNNDFDNCTYTEQTGTGTDATTYSRLPAIISGINGTSLIQNDLDVMGKVGIGTITPGNYRLYVNGGQFGTLLKGGDLGVGSDVVRMLKSDDSIAMIVRGDGNVGIGTTSPANLLTVNGNMRLVTATTQGLFSYDQPNGGSFIFSITRYTNQGTNDLNINALGGFAVKVGSSATANTGHEFYINSSGNVGIGTTAPAKKFTVRSSANDTTTFAGFYALNETQGVEIWYGGIQMGGSNGNVDFNIASKGTGNVLITNGNLGIANATPSTKFEINTPTYATFTGSSSVARFNALAGTGAATALLLTNYVGDLSTDTTVDLDFAALDGNSVIGAVPHARIGYTGAYNDGINTDPSLEARGYFRIATRGEGAGGVLADRLLIDHTGKVRFLNYTSAAAFTGTVVASLAVDSSGNIITTAPGGVSGTGTANYVTKWSDADTIANSIIFDDGTNVGVGTNAPNVKLDVNGTLDVRNVFGGYARFSPTAGNSSQARLSIRLKPTSTTERTVTAFVENGSVGVGGTITDDAALTGATLVATGSGNVGIGITAPYQALHVNGNILLDGLAAGYSQSATRGIGYGSNSGAVSVDGFSGMDIQSVNAPAPYNGNYSQNLRFFTHHYGSGTGGTPRMFIQYTGNVGIGTVSPASRLHVTGGTDSNPTISIGTINTSTGNAEIDFYSGTAGSYNGFSLKYTKTSTIDRFGFIDGGGVESFVVLNGGNVGIGTVTPTDKLSVSGSTNAALGVRILNSTNNTAANSYLAVGPAGSSLNIISYPTNASTRAGTVFLNTDSGVPNGILITTDAGPIRFSSASTTGSQMYLSTSGNLGLANTSPSYILDAASASGGSITTIRVNNGYTGASDGSQLLLGNSANFTNAYFRLNGGGNSSQAGIGSLNIGVTQSVDMAFYTNNVERIRVSGAGAVTITGTLTVTGTITEQSALRYKENVVPVTAALDKVDQLQPVTYNKKGSTTKEIGLIAEDVFDVYPEFVLCDDNGNPVGIHYSRLTAVLVESVKELKKEINELKNRN